MKVIYMPRCSGRTTALIERCSAHDNTLIVCPSFKHVKETLRLALELGKKIPTPITFRDLMDGKLRGEHVEAILIDDLDTCLASYLCDVPIDTVVICDQESRQLNSEEYICKLTPNINKDKNATCYIVEELVRCKDCENRGDVACPMYSEEWYAYDDDGYLEHDYVTNDETFDDGFCDRGTRRKE